MTLIEGLFVYKYNKDIMVGERGKLHETEDDIASVGDWSISAKRLQHRGSHGFYLDHACF